jgi:hypothetical protein
MCKMYLFIGKRYQITQAELNINIGGYTYISVVDTYIYIVDTYIIIEIGLCIYTHLSLLWIHISILRCPAACIRMYLYCGYKLYIKLYRSFVHISLS